MRERTPMTAALLSALPQLRLIASNAPQNASIDLNAAGALGIEVVHTAYFSSPTIELTLALLLACARNIPLEHNNVQQGRWQTTIGADLKAATLGVIGLGNVGGEVARIAIAMGMKVIAWSQNLSPAVAASQGVIAVSREALFERSDFISVHVQLSERTKGLVGRDEFLKMKPTARLITTPHIGYVSRDLFIGTRWPTSSAGSNHSSDDASRQRRQ